MRNVWKQQTDCILDVRITNHSTFIGNRNRKQSFVPMSAKRRRNTSTSTWDQRRHFSPFVVSFGNEAKVLFRNFKLHEVKDEYCNCTSHTSMHPKNTHPHEPNEPTSPVREWSRPQPVSCTIMRTKNVSQN